MALIRSTRAMRFDRSALRSSQDQKLGPDEPEWDDSLTVHSCFTGPIWPSRSILPSRRAVASPIPSTWRTNRRPTFTVASVWSRLPTPPGWTRRSSSCGGAQTLAEMQTASFESSSGMAEFRTAWSPKRGSSVSRRPASRSSSGQEDCHGIRSRFATERPEVLLDLSKPPVTVVVAHQGRRDEVGGN